MLNRARKGQWVTYKGKVGILNNLYPCEVHLTDENGETTEIINVDISTLKDAFQDEIPKKRINHPHAKAFVKAHYERRK